MRTFCTLPTAARRAASRGVTLIEVLIVVAILALIAGGVGINVVSKYKDSAIKLTYENATSIRNTANRVRAMSGGADCPTMASMVAAKEIDAVSKTDDPWNTAYQIKCTEDEVIVVSAGPDKNFGTADDITVPKGYAVPKLWARGRARRSRLTRCVGLYR